MLGGIHMIHCDSMSGGNVFVTYRQNEDSLLHQAAAKNRQDIMMMLLQKGADINARSSNGSTVLHMHVQAMAAARGDVWCSQFFVSTTESTWDGLCMLQLSTIITTLMS